MCSWTAGTAPVLMGHLPPRSVSHWRGQMCGCPQSSLLFFSTEDTQSRRLYLFKKWVMSLGTLFIKCSDRRLACLFKAAGLQRHLFSFNLLSNGSTSQRIQLTGPVWRRPEYSRTSESGVGLSFLLHRLWFSRLVSMRWETCCLLSFYMKCVCFCWNHIFGVMHCCDDVINV